MNIATWPIIRTQLVELAEVRLNSSAAKIDDGIKSTPLSSGRVRGVN